MAKKIYTRFFKEAFADLEHAYTSAASDRHPEMRFEDAEQAERVLDKLLLDTLGTWPAAAQAHLGDALGAFLLYHRASLITALTPSDWNLFSDPADAFHGYVFRTMFEPAGYEIQSYAQQAIDWDSTPTNELIDGPLRRPGIDSMG